MRTPTVELLQRLIEIMERSRAKHSALRAKRPKKIGQSKPKPDRATDEFVTARRSVPIRTLELV